MASLSAMTGIAFADSDSSDFKTGHGTAESPYEITSVEEFNNVRYHLGAHFKQKDNLDLSGSEFSPIGSVTFPFTGYYDGGQYQISNVHIKQNSNNVGLFAFVDNGGVVENLKIVNAEIKGEYNVGSIAGTNRGLVIGCVSAADVLGNGAVGGIVGLNAVGGKVKECGNTGNVYSNKTEGMYVGGIVGVNNSLVQNCYNHGRINSEDNTSITYSGGIVGLESIELNFADSFKHTESLVLDVNVAPENATYKNDIIYEILDDSADSRIESGILYAEKPGTVTVKVTADGISAEKAISVLKESVQSVSLNAVYQESNNGETYQFVASVYPANATNQDVTYILKSGKATLSETGLLLIDPTIPAGSLIEVYAIVDGIESSIYEIKSGRIDVESVSLVPETETIKVGEGVRLITSTIPAVVSNPGITYIVDGNAEVMDGVLYVFDTEAVGTIVNVTAVVDGVESQVVSINVVATPVENVTFACANSFKVTGSLKLTVTVYPQSATDKTVAYTIISGKEIGAEIIDGYLYAEKIGVVKVRATVGDISRDLVVCVQKEPVTKIVFTSPFSVKVNNVLKLSATAYPLNATFKDVSFELIHNDINAEIIDGNTLFSSQVGKVTVRVIADDTYEDFEIEVIKEPVTGLVFAKTTFKHTESLNLVTRVLPGNATYNEVSYTILNNYVGYKDIGARIENGRLYANEPGFIRLLITTDNGDYSETVEIEVTKEPVIGITMADFDEPLRLDYGYRVGQIDLGTIVYPLNATYQHIEYSIKES